MLHIILCYVPVLGGWLLFMKDSGGERMHYPYGECILSRTDFVVGSECLAGDVHGGKRPKSSEIRVG